MDKLWASVEKKRPVEKAARTHVVDAPGEVKIKASDDISKSPVPDRLSRKFQGRRWIALP